MIRKIEDAFGDLPIAALNDQRVTKDFLDWRDSMASSPRQADYAWTVLVRILSWARSRTLTTYRPPQRIERLYHSDRSDLIWEDHHIAAFNAVASEALQWALLLAAETGLRQGDIVALPWSAYDPTDCPVQEHHLALPKGKGRRHSRDATAPRASRQTAPRRPGHSHAKQWADLEQGKQPWLAFQRGEDRGWHYRS